MKTNLLISKANSIMSINQFVKLQGNKREWSDCKSYTKTINDKYLKNNKKKELEVSSYENFAQKFENKLYFAKSENNNKMFNQLESLLSLQYEINEKIYSLKSKRKKEKVKLLCNLEKNFYYEKNVKNKIDDLYVSKKERETKSVQRNEINKETKNEKRNINEIINQNISFLEEECKNNENKLKCKINRSLQKHIIDKSESKIKNKQNLDINIHKISNSTNILKHNINEEICSLKTEKTYENYNSVKNNVYSNGQSDIDRGQKINNEIYFSERKKKKAQKTKNYMNEIDIKENVDFSVIRKKDLTQNNDKKSEINKSTKETSNNEKISFKKENALNPVENLSLEINENLTFLHKQNRKSQFLSQYKDIKLNKILLFSNGDWYKEYLKFITKSSKMAAIQKNLKDFTFLKYHQINLNSTLSNQIHRKRKVSKSMEMFKLKDQINNSKPGDKLKTIKLNGNANVNFHCQFKHSFLLSLHISELFLEDLLEKQNLLSLRNCRNHCRITIKLNDFIVDEDDLRWNKITIESSTKLGLIKVLDKVDKTFPYWEIWKNGALNN